MLLFHPTTYAVILVTFALLMYFFLLTSFDCVVKILMILQNSFDLCVFMPLVSNKYIHRIIYNCDTPCKSMKGGLLFQEGLLFLWHWYKGQFLHATKLIYLCTFMGAGLWFQGTMLPITPVLNVAGTVSRFKSWLLLVRSCSDLSSTCRGSRYVRGLQEPRWLPIS